MNSNNAIVVRGIGAVSPAGWGMEAFRNALNDGDSIAAKSLVRPGWENGLHVRQVPAPATRPAFLAHARLRRTSPIAQYAVAAALEALGSDVTKINAGELRLGLVYCAMSGCVNYSRRFYEEVLREPSTASPLVFPETVFNAPSSHIAALLGTKAINYTIIGDPGTYLQGLALAAEWLEADKVDGCLVIGSEEIDWLTSDAYRLFQPNIVLGDGAGAIYLQRGGNDSALVRLNVVTDSHLFLKTQSRHCAAEKMRAELPAVTGKRVICDSTQDLPRLDAAENAAWQNVSAQRVSPKRIFGEGLMAAAAWQCVAAVDLLQRGECDAVDVSVVGCNQQAIGTQFVVSKSAI